MSSNARIILQDLIKQVKDSRFPDLSDSDFFEIFLNEQVLKDYNLSYEELETGLVGKGGDGGVDGFYPFINGNLLYEDTDVSELRKNIHFELYVIQARTSQRFDETTIDKFKNIAEDLLDLSRNMESLASVYNSELLERVEVFRSKHRALTRNFPELTLNFVFGTQGDATRIHPNVERKKIVLEEKCKEFFPKSMFSFSFLGAREILDLAERRPQNTYNLELINQPLPCVYPVSADTVGYICLVQNKSYFKFLCDPGGNINNAIFESNVRDYQGTVEVNKSIAKTLEVGEKEDFWWLNNGITIIATKVSIAGNTMTIQDPQIVNGLQSSMEIYEFYSKHQETSDQRSILLRVIDTQDEESRDNIIKATNSQTVMPQVSLRATETIHRNIEHFLKTKGFYYDRRKNFYKNSGAKLEKIISIGHLAQAIMAAVLLRPDDSRARPSSLLKKEEDYHKIFSETYPIQLYLVCAKLLKDADKFIRSTSTDRDIEYIERINLRFHLMMYLVLYATKKVNPSITDVMDIDFGRVTETMYKHCLGKVIQVFRQIRESTGEAPDKIAKSRNFVTQLITEFGNELRNQ